MQMPEFLQDCLPFRPKQVYRLMLNPTTMSFQVVVRVRPFTTREKEASQALSVLITPSEVTLYASVPLTYPVDTAIWSNGDEEDLGLAHVDNRGVFERVGRGVVGEVQEGKDCCVISYGANATGKSYTLFGGEGETGLIQLSAIELLAATSQLCISMLEVHGNCLKDLLTGRDSLSLHTTAQSVSIENLTYRAVFTPADLEAAVSLGRRTWASNSSNRMNSLSKPTHVLVKLKAVLSDGRKANLLFVDLAGEERTARLSSPRKETIAVNQSIRTFKETIKGLAAQRPGQKAVLPFRESVLTRVLRKPLEGVVVLMATVAPAASAMQENMATLELCKLIRKRSSSAR